ncbi:MAG: hypothetical protein ACO3XH_01150 [Candidatus Nanopelagicales bacterium]
MRLTINPEIDVIWLSNTSIQVSNAAGQSFKITDLPLEIKDIFTEIDGVKQLADIFTKIGIDERIHNDINESIILLINQKVFLNKSNLHEKYEHLKNSYVLIKGLNTAVYQIAHLLASNGIGRIVIEDLVKSNQIVSLADINVFSPRAKEIGTSLSKSIKNSLSYFDVKLDKPDNQILPDLIILCDEISEIELNEIIMKEIPHLYVRKTNDFIHIGPFNIPDAKLCFKCQQILKIKQKLSFFDFNKKRIRQIDNHPVLTTLASSLAVTNVISFLSKELKDKLPILTNVICELDPLGPAISFKQIKQNNNCECKWLAA